MSVELHRRIWRTLAASALSLAATVALAEQPTSGSTPDIRQALIFTGHYSALNSGQPSVLLRRASQSWQTAKSHKVTDTLPPEELKDLLLEGQKRRYALGWTMLRDKSVGFDVGVPTKLVKFVDTRTYNSSLIYKFEGDIDYQVLVRYGDFDCGSSAAYYSYMVKNYRLTHAARRDNWFSIAWSANEKSHYWKWMCSASGAVFAGVSLSEEQRDEQDVLFTALADSFTLGPRFNPTASSRPMMDDPPTRPEGYQEKDGVLEAKPVELPAGIDGLGKVSSLRLAGRSATEMRAEQIFRQAGAAVYMVKALPRLGSAVAISDHELLTNCHVLGDLTRVTLLRDHKELPAQLVSAFDKGDRCVLKTEEKLPAWVRVRSYDSITVGEQAFSIGTPVGLELTLAEGIVSSKRVLEERRYIQTSAPVSPGSSGGGLFDAQGQLLGVTTFQIRGAQNLNFAIAGEEYAK